MLAHVLHLRTTQLPKMAKLVVAVELANQTTFTWTTFVQTVV